MMRTVVLSTTDVRTAVLRYVINIRTIVLSICGVVRTTVLRHINNSIRTMVLSHVFISVDNDVRRCLRTHSSR